MEAVLTIVEKVLGLITSQRFITTVAGLVVGALVLFNMIMPMFQPDFTEVGVPSESELVAQISAYISQAAVAVTFLIGLFRAIAGMVSSIETHPPTLAQTWADRNMERLT